MTKHEQSSDQLTNWHNCNFPLNYLLYGTSYKKYMCSRKDWAIHKAVRVVGGLEAQEWMRYLFYFIFLIIKFPVFLRVWRGYITLGFTRIVIFFSFMLFRICLKTGLAFPSVFFFLFFFPLLLIISLVTLQIKNSCVVRSSALSPSIYRYYKNKIIPFLRANQFQPMPRGWDPWQPRHCCIFTFVT